MAANNNLVLTEFSSFNGLGGTYQAIKREELYQYVVAALRKGLYENQLGGFVNQLITATDHALAMRDIDAADRASEILLNVPLPRKHHGIGYYYKAMCIFHRGGYIKARTMLERLAESEAAPLKYRARALEAIGAAYHDTGDDTEALRFFLQAGHAASLKHGGDLLTSTLSQWMIAVIKSVKGDNCGALEDLERLSSSVRLLAADQPFIFYSYSNSLAVEMGELGCIEEAQSASRIALASPYGCAHPEWRETYDGIQLKSLRASRSIVSISSSLSDLDIDNGASSEGSEPNSTPSNLSIFPSGRNRPAKASYNLLDEKIAASDLRWMTTAQKRSFIMEIAQFVGIGDEVLDRMIKAAGVVESEDTELPDEQVDAGSRIVAKAEPTEQKGINLEAENRLERLIRLWVNGECGPDEFAAVMSVLRDCADDARRNNILDRMISYSFYETRERMESEAEWRKRVEASLTDDEEPS